MDPYFCGSTFGSKIIEGPQNSWSRQVLNADHLGIPLSENIPIERAISEAQALLEAIKTAIKQK